MPSTVLNTLHTLIIVILTSLSDGCHYYLCFTDDKSETERQIPWQIPLTTSRVVNGRASSLVPNSTLLITTLYCLYIKMDH